MGIITHIADDWDEEDRVHTIFAVTSIGINNRSALNRVATRAAVTSNVGQRILVAAAYDEEGINVVWNRGLGVTVPLEEKWPEAQDIEYHTVTFEDAPNFGAIAELPARRFTGQKLRDFFLEDIPTFRDTDHLHVWEIPYEIEGR